MVEEPFLCHVNHIDIMKDFSEDDVSSSDDEFGDEDQQLLHWKCSTKYIEDLPWFHGDMTRNTSEALLLANGVEGSYLMRNSRQNPGSYTVSVRCSDSIKHYSLFRNTFKDTYSFGIANFDSYSELIDHFECKPVLGGETGLAVVLRFPYIKDVPEPSNYEKVLRHAEDGKEEPDESQDIQQVTDLHIASKEGYLIKRGAIHKNWKKRWFVLRKNILQYFADKEDTTPLRMIDLRHAVIATEDRCDNKPNCFSVVLPQRTFFFFAGSLHEAKAWLALIQWKIQYYKVRRVSEDQATLSRRRSEIDSYLKQYTRK